MDDKLKKKVLIGVPLALVALVLIYFFAIFPRAGLLGLEKGYVEVTIDKEGKADFKVTDKKPKGWVTLKEVSPFAANAIVVSEDWAFYNHNGYDPNQIKEAVNEALEGERTRGASTISQQVIKNVFLTPEKTLTRKLKEIMYSTYMEKNVSKEKILETYLNIAEFAPGVYGIKAAAKHYFNKAPKKLSPKEGAFLAMLLPSPKRYSQSFREKKMTDFAKNSVDNILEKMVVAKYLPKEDLVKAKKSHFNWEKEAKKEAKAKTTFKKRSRKSRRGGPTGAGEKINYRVDSDLMLEENPDFDDDAINEDLDGIKAEFNVQ